MWEAALIIICITFVLKIILMILNSILKYRIDFLTVIKEVIECNNLGGRK